MKKGTKLLLGFSGICASVGIVLLIAGLILGISTAQFWDALSLDLGEMLGWGKDSQQVQEEVGKLEDISDPGSLPYNWKSTAFPQVKSLSLEMDGGVVRMESYDGDEVQVCTQTDDGRTEMEMSGSCLEITQKDRKLFRQVGKAIKIYVPRGYSFEEVEMDLGATDFQADSLNAREISAQVGAGVLCFNGQITARDSSWEVGMGVLELKALDSERIQLETGMGTARATLRGNQQEYELDGTLGMGSLDFGDFSGNMPGEHLVNEGGVRTVEVSCGMGKVEIDFTE